MAVAWQRASGGDWMAYAAAVAARSAIRARPDVDNTLGTLTEVDLFDHVPRVIAEVGALVLVDEVDEVDGDIHPRGP
ncbi:hypothetical protein SUDANB145_01669 [Streptomyces sp. enrichment culture]